MSVSAHNDDAEAMLRTHQRDLNAANDRRREDVSLKNERMSARAREPCFGNTHSLSLRLVSPLPVALLEDAERKAVIVDGLFCKPTCQIGLVRSS